MNRHQMRQTGQNQARDDWRAGLARPARQVVQVNLLSDDRPGWAAAILATTTRVVPLAPEADTQMQVVNLVANRDFATEAGEMLLKMGGVPVTQHAET